MKGGRQEKSRLPHKLSRLGDKILAYLGNKDAHAAVFLVSGAEMKRFKSRFFKRMTAKQVDVLSFPEPGSFPHPESRGRFLGEIYLNRELNGATFKHYGSLLSHGLLHLLGYTHKKKGDTLKMERLEERLKELLIGK